MNNTINKRCFIKSGIPLFFASLLPNVFKPMILFHLELIFLDETLAR